MNDSPPDGRIPADESRRGTTDPVRERRVLIARWTAVASRSGYSLYGLAIALFIAGLAAGWSQSFTVAITVSLVLGSVLLAPAIVLGYAIKAAEREDVDFERRRRGPSSP